MLNEWIRCLRPRQWVKNGFVLLPLFFSGSLLNVSLLERAVLGFFCFSFLASGLYVMNDIMDRNEDQKNRLKKDRPIAKGSIVVRDAWIVSVLFISSSLGAAFYLDFSFGLTTLAYAFLVTFYTFWLKRLIIFDTISIALGFVLRVLGGGIVVDIVVSNWLFITVAFMALFLAIMKRRAEFFIQNQEQSRAVLVAYTPELFTQMIAVSSTGIIISYALYTFSNDARNLSRWSLFILIYAVFRYLSIAFRDGEGAEPERFIFKDRPFFFSVLVFILYMGVIIYVYA